MSQYFHLDDCNGTGSDYEEPSEKTNEGDIMIEKRNESEEPSEKTDESEEMLEKTNESKEMFEKTDESEEMFEKTNESEEMFEKTDESEESIEKTNESEESIEKTNESEESIEQTNEREVDFPLYLIRPIDLKGFTLRNCVESNYEECKTVLDELEANGPIEDSLSAFIGQCAGIPVNEEEMINDVRKGLKSYEKGVDEYCSLQSVLKRRRQTNMHLAPLESCQLDGFQLLAPKPNQPLSPETLTMTDLTNKSEKRKRASKKEKKEPKVGKIKLLRTGGNSWEAKELPQKIVPIYSEQISGKPKRRNSSL